MSTDRTELRYAEAEAPLVQRARRTAAPIRPAEALLQELQVHQIELEKQNENLRQTQLALEESRDRYLDLYEFAPVAYLTLNDHGLICEINLTGSALFGVERNSLINRGFAQFIVAEARERWDRCLLHVMTNSSNHSYELQLQRYDGSVFFAHLACLRIETGNGGHAVRITLTDITSRLQTEISLRESEISLRESEEKFHAIFEGTLDGIVLIDDTGMIVDCNPEFIRQSGMTAEQLKQTRIWELRPADKAEQARNIFFEAMKTGSGGSADIKFKRADGKVIYVGVRGSSISIGGKSYLQCITHDITGRRQMEMEIAQSRQKLNVDHLLFQAILDNAPIGIWMLGTDHKIKFINKTFCNAVGFSEQQFLSAIHYSDLLPPAVSSNCMKSDRECFTQEMPHLSEEWLPFVDGHNHLLEITKVVLSDAEGSAIGLIGLAADITERRQAEERAQISAQKNRLLFESSHDALITMAPPSWKFSGANEAALKLFGAASVEEFTALGTWDVSPELQPDGRLSSEKVQEMIAAAISAGSQSFEWEHQRLGGQPFTSDVLLTRMDLGNESFLHATVRDIGERKRAENELREYQQLLRELAAQGAASREAKLKHIAREVHDELGQILTALRMDISLLRIRFGEHDPDLMKNIQDMLVLVDKAIRGVRNVAVNLRPPALDMGIVPAITWLGDEFAARTTTTCTVSVIDDPAVLDDTHTLTLFRIVQESLTNITRYAQATHVAITITKCDENICVEVRDDGKGFDVGAARAEKSFGLMGMKERALAVCGEVEITSVPSEGTVVSVRIPLYETNSGRNIND